MASERDIRRQAIDPTQSVWVQAHAGSGKTTLLMNRLLALMLSGTAPEQILCATHTRAAAHEIINRVSQQLFAWSTADDKTLSNELIALFGEGHGYGSASILSVMKTLYVDIEDRLRVETLHRFCDRLLREYPLEAGLLPNFEVLGQEDERLERLLFFRSNLAKTVELVKKQSTLKRNFSQMLARYDVDQWLEKLASRAPDQTRAVLSTGTELEKLLERNFADYKKSRNWINHDEQVSFALRLLTSADENWLSQFKRDQQIEHILLDETQDMDGAQWALANKLTEDFFTRHEVSNKTIFTEDFFTRHEARNKTIFAVGDVKQTIYRWRGAQPDLFIKYGDEYRQRLEKFGAPFKRLSSTGSFRSGPRILHFVDRLFSGLSKEKREAGYFSDLQHGSQSRHQQDMVKVWLPPSDEDIKKTGVGDLRKQMAKRVAQEIADLLESKTALACRGYRAVTAGDVMVVLRERADMHREIADNLRQLNVPVAEQDRIKLGEHLGVQDLLALVKFVLLSHDDFNLAVLLKGPLFSCSDDNLLTLRVAQQVTSGSFWNTINRLACGKDTTDFWQPIQQTLADLIRSYASSLSGHDFLSRLLVTYREAFPLDQGINALLDYCYEYERKHDGSLVEFLAYFEQRKNEIKCDLDLQEQKVRIVTVHGAKGLQAPVIFFVNVASRRPGGKRASDEDDYESILYVGLTRAEELLYIFVQEKKLVEGSWCHLLKKVCHSITEEPQAYRARITEGFWTLGKAQPAAVKSEDKAIERLVVPEWVHPVVAAEVVKEARFARHAWFSLARFQSMQRGTALHQLLELLPRLAREEWEQVGQQWLSKCLRGMDVRQRQELLSEVLASLQTLHDDKQLRCLFAPDSLAEVTIVDGDELYRIDRMCQCPDHCVILDYKSDLRVPATPDLTPKKYLRQLWEYGQVAASNKPKKYVIMWIREAKIMTFAEDWLRRKIEESADD